MKTKCFYIFSVFFIGLSLIMPISLLADFYVIPVRITQSGITYKNILKRGEVWVGVLNWDMPGFYEQQGSVGLEADLARALAAAIFADTNKIRFIPISAGERFTGLQEERYDVLLRVSTFTLGRDTSLNLHFCPTYFYDGQGVMMGNSGSTLTDLDGKKIAVMQTADYQYNLAKFMMEQGLTYEEVLYNNSSQMFADYQSGEVDAVSYDKSALNAYRSSFGKPTDHVIFDEMLSKEPLSPVVRHDDDAWYDIVKWVIYALFEAEELGINSTNADVLLGSTNPAVRRFLGVEGTLGQDLGLSNDCFYQIIKQVGNYGEIYHRNLGPSTPTYLPRGQNELHTEGGLLYSPPMR